MLSNERKGNRFRAVCRKILLKGGRFTDKCCKTVLLKEVASQPIRSRTTLRDYLYQPPGSGWGRRVPKVGQGGVDELALQSRSSHPICCPVL